MSPEQPWRLTSVTRKAVVVEVRGPLGPGGSRLLCEQVRRLLQDGNVTCDLQGTADLGVVDALARIALMAKGLGRQVCLSGDDGGLLALTGLEVIRQAEAREQVRVEEVVDVLDPSG